MNAKEIKDLRRLMGKNQEEFAEILGVHKNTVYNWEKGERVPDTKTSLLLQLKSQFYDNKKTTDTERMLSLPLIPIDAIAGDKLGDNPGVTFNDCEQYLVPEFMVRGAEFLIRVSGSSMYPKYSNGDILACKKIQEITFIQWGRVYVIDSSQGSLVKRLFEGKDDEHLLCVSDNKENYPPFQLPRSDIRTLSLVIGVIRLE